MEPAAPRAKQRVFIIHGRNQRAVEELSKFLLAIGVEPWPFETVSASLGGNPFIDQVVRAGIDGSAAIIALFTPDERAKLRFDYELPTDKPRDRLRWQCRANVLYETGLAFATAGAAERTLIVVAGPVDLPTDFDGRHLLRLSNEPAPRRRLRQHFAEAGCVLADDPREAFLDPKHGNFDDDVIVGAAIAAQNPMGLDPKKIDLVLGPGGVRCAAFAGAIAALERHGFVIDSVCGVSAGSLVGAMYAGGVAPDALIAAIRDGDLMAGVRPPSRLGWLRVLWPPFAAQQPVEAEMFRKMVPSDPTFAQLRVQLGVAALDLSKGRLLAYTPESHPRMKVADALTLSTAVPLFYPGRQEPPDRLIVDAAVQTHLPLWLPAALGKSRNRVVALSVGLTSFQKPANFGAYIARLFDASVLASDYLAVLRSRRLVRIRIPVRDYEPLDRLNRGQRSELILQGEEAVDAAVQSGGLNPARPPRLRAAPASLDPHERAQETASAAALRYARELQEFSAELDDEA